MRSRPFVLTCLCLPVCMAAQTYSVLTYNIRYMNSHDGRNGWEARKEAVASTLMEHRPHVFGLQEVLREQLAYLKDRLPGYAHFGVGRDDGMGSGEFAPVFYDTATFTLLEGSTIWLSPTPDVPSKGWDATCNRILTLAILRDRSTGDSLWVANTHWDAAGSEARQQSALLTSDLLAGPIARGKHVIFMGDLNSTARESPVRHMGERMADACPKGRSGKGTFNAFKRLRLCSKRIDYVWLAPGKWSVESYAVPHPKVKCRQVSDHFPIVVRLRAT